MGDRVERIGLFPGMAISRDSNEWYTYYCVYNRLVGALRLTIYLVPGTHYVMR